MEYFSAAAGAKKIVETCAVVKPGEQVLVVTDNDRAHLAPLLAGAATAAGAEVVVSVMEPRRLDSNDVPRAVAAAMKAADVILLLVSKSASHSQGVRDALANGARALALTGFKKHMFLEGGLEADFHAQRPLCDALANAFSEADEAHLTTPAGTDLRLDLRGRPGNSHGCILDKPGTFSGTPNIEANVSPVEGSAEGVIVFDGSIPYFGIGVLNEPVIMEVAAGNVSKIHGGPAADKLRALLSSQGDQGVYNVAQLAVGLNPKCVAFTGELPNDHGPYGTVHIGIGTSASLGGTIHADLHWDGMMYSPTLRLDGKTVVEDGDVVLSI